MRTYGNIVRTERSKTGRESGGTLQDASFPLYDAHGNMVNTLSRGTGGSFTLGNSSFRYYDAWGSLDAGPGTGNEPRQRYCANLGHLQDDESGLIYMRARNYEPGTGRFVSEDPARHGGNWYAYCDSNPTNKCDYSGKWAALVILGAFLGGVTAWLCGVSSGLDGWKLTVTIVVGIAAGALSALTGVGVMPLVSNFWGTIVGGAAGGIIGNFVNTLANELLTNGPSRINWGRIGRNMGIGGVLGLAFGAIGALAQKNSEIAAALAGINADLWGNVADTAAGGSGH